MVNHQERLTCVFAALADSTRRRILQQLYRRGESRVTALARPFRISLPAVSKHLRVLEEAGLICRERVGRVHRIRANVSGIQHAQKWIARYVAAWETRFDALGKLLSEKPPREDST